MAVRLLAVLKKKKKRKKKEKERKIKIKSHCVGSFGASVIQHAASAQGYDLF